MKRHSQQDIEVLLGKFMDGQTTLEEEKALADYFRTHDVPQEWEDYRAMFDYFDHGMEGDLVPAEAALKPLTALMGRRWWGIAAAAAVTAAIVTLTVLRTPESSISQPPATTEAQEVDTPVTALPEVEMQRLAVANPPKPATQNNTAVATSKTRRLRAQNDSLRAQNERLKRELEDLRRRAFIIDMEANGFKAVMSEDGHIVFIDMEQEIEKELNQQLSNNIPEI